MRKIGYSGVFEVEFLRDKAGRLYFLEINFRHTQYNHALTDMGVNLSKVWMDSCLAGHLELKSVRMPDRPYTVINEIRDYHNFIQPGKLSKKQ